MSPTQAEELFLAELVRSGVGVVSEAESCSYVASCDVCRGAGLQDTEAKHTKDAAAGTNYNSRIVLCVVGT